MNKTKCPRFESIELSTETATRGNRVNTIVNHAELKKVIYETLPKLGKVVKCTYSSFSNILDDVVVKCTIEIDGVPYEALGESVASSRTSLVDKTNPTICAQNKAFDRAVILLLGFYEKVYSNLELAPDSVSNLGTANFIDGENNVTPAAVSPSEEEKKAEIEPKKEVSVKKEENEEKKEENGEKKEEKIEDTLISIGKYGAAPKKVSLVYTTDVAWMACIARIKSNDNDPEVARQAQICGKYLDIKGYKWRKKDGVAK